MKITILNRIGKPAEKHLKDYRTRFPAYILTKEKAYNGIVIEIDDDDAEDFYEALESAGFNYETDEDDSSTSNVPKLPKLKPKFPKAAPKFPKTKPIFQKVRPKLPRFLS